MKRWFFTLLFVAAGMVFMGSANAASANGLDVRDLMTARQYQRAGLGKLSAQQLKQLNSWLTSTAQQYHHGPLSKLSARQRAVFTAWLNRYLTGRRSSNQPPVAALPAPKAHKTHPRRTPTPAPQSTKNRQAATNESNSGKSSSESKEQEKTPDKVVSRIDGKFSGWHGNTVFKLQNGQVWKQADSGARLDVTMKNPKVTIRSLLIGYGLRVQGHPQMVFVRRIK